MVLRTDADWVQHCSGPPDIDFAEEIVVGVFLEDDCAFSGCTSHAPLIQRVTRRGCRVEVQARELKTAELGLCNACAHPFDMVVVAAEDASGLVELR